MGLPRTKILLRPKEMPIWPCLGLAAVTCAVAVLVAALLWLVLRRRRPATPLSATGVHIITDLRGFLRKYPDAVVLFHASWCSHCTQLLPTYTQVAAQISRPLGTMLCDHADEVVQQYGLRGYPTILKFRDGRKVAEHQGKRSSDDIAAFCRT